MIKPIYKGDNYVHTVNQYQFWISTENVGFFPKQFSFLISFKRTY